MIFYPLHLVLVDVQPGVHEDVVHLHEHEHHIEDGVHPEQDLPKAACPGNLERSKELQPGVDERPQPEGDGADAEEEAAVALVVQGGHQLHLNFLSLVLAKHNGNK